MVSPIPSLVATNREVLVPIFKITVFLGGTVLTATGITAFFAPSTIASSFGLPLPSSFPSTPFSIITSPYHSDTPRSTPPASVKDARAWGFADAQGWIIAFAGRETAMGLTSLTLLGMGEYRALSVVMMAGTLVGASSTIATWKFGREGGWKSHFYSTLATSWLGPVGLLLFKESG